MVRMLRRVSIIAVILLAAAPARADYLYKALFLRAAPGKLLDTIALYKSRMPVYDASGDARPFLMRHSQGDQWDLLLLFPMESWTAYFSADRVANRERAAREAGVPQAEFARRFYEAVAWHEEVFVEGPPLEEVRKRWDGAGFFHVEMFISLPGKQAELRREREMENKYLEGVGRHGNLIFTHDQGAAWDLFTIGFYRDLPHYAESAGIAPEKAEASARAAGFRGTADIGPYLRTLIASHHDTLCVTVK
jgi:hypothetical protein